jgi:hypothetical protein
MEFLRLHINGRPALFRLDSIEGVLPPTMSPRGVAPQGCFVVSNMDGMSHLVDENFDDVETALAGLEIDIIDVAND